MINAPKPLCIRKDVFGNCLKIHEPALRSAKGHYSIKLGGNVPSFYPPKPTPPAPPTKDPPVPHRRLKEKKDDYTELPGFLVNPRKYPISKLNLEMKEALHTANAAQIWQNNRGRKMPTYDDRFRSEMGQELTPEVRKANTQRYLDERYPGRFEVHPESSDNVLILKRYKNPARRIAAQEAARQPRGENTVRAP